MTTVSRERWSQCCSSPRERRKKEQEKKKETFLQDERSRKAEHFNAEVLN